MLIPLDQVDPSLDGVRKRAPGAARLEEMTRSIAALGVLQPILVARSGNRYILVKGELRCQAARLAGLLEIPAEVGAGFTGAHAVAAHAAASLVRAPLHPIDRWRAMARLQDEGYGMRAAADALGLSVREAARMDRLGRLHPDVLALIDEHGLPEDRELAAIASAPLETQALAIERYARGNGRSQIAWYQVAQACRCQRIPRSRAIFDIEGAAVRWDEDLFAEPGAADEFTTVDVAGFLAAQKVALEALVLAGLAAKKRVARVGWDSKLGQVVIPAGWEESYSHPESPKKGETVLMAVALDGYRIGEIAKRTARKTASAKHGVAGDADEGGDEIAPPHKASMPPMTKAGQCMVAVAKTQAIRDRLVSPDHVPIPSWELLGLLVMALTGSNVRIEGDARNQWVSFADMLPVLVGADGLFPKPGLDPDDVRALAAEALGRIVVIARPERWNTSGDAGEWIGRAIGADRALPRLDTAEFLATLSHAELKRVAGEQQVKATGTATAHRLRLAGAMEQWRPCRFEAPGPAPAGDEAFGEGAGDA